MYRTLIVKPGIVYKKYLTKLLIKSLVSTKIKIKKKLYVIQFSTKNVINQHFIILTIFIF